MNNTERTCLICLGDRLDNFLATNVITSTPGYAAKIEVISTSEALLAKLQAMSLEEADNTDVVFGVRMPGLDGFDLYTKLSDEIRQRARCYLVGVALDGEQEKTHKQYEHLYFITKPLTANGFGKIIATPR